MSTAFFLATLVVAFLAGIVALAMPCCFTVLLPTYLAKSFDTTTGRLGMTAVFATGIATVLLPIAVGVSFVASFIATNHAILFVLGGFFMVVLGLLTLYGISIFPHTNFGVDLNRRDVPSVYALGVVGGVASSCCAPVLAGVIILATLGGSWFSSVTIGLAYVIGMVFPLLLVAIAWDRRAQGSSSLLRGRMVRFRLLGHSGEIHSSKLIAGGLLLTMGAFTAALGALNQMILNPGSALFGIYQTWLVQALTAAFSNPGFAMLIGILVAGSVTLAVFGVRRRRRRARALCTPAHAARASDPAVDPDDLEV
jgi:cytochrome c biogenesis protein CcdA